MANQVELLSFLSILTPLIFQGEALFSKFSDLNLIVLSIEDLPLKLFDLDSVGLYLGRESFDFYGLEDHHERQVVSEVGFSIVGQVLDSGLLELLVADVAGELCADEGAVAYE